MDPGPEPEMGSAEDLREGREGFEFELFALGLAPLFDLEASAGGGFPSGYFMCSIPSFSEFFYNSNKKKDVIMSE